MTSLASSGGVLGKCKKNNSVIYKTTSETLRLGDDTSSSSPSIINNKLTITSSATISRKKSQIQSPSCSFQITGIMTRYDQEDESADDLDESHTDEISRVTDNETPSYSEDSRDDQQLLYSSSVQNNQNNMQNLQQQQQQQQPQHTISAPILTSSANNSTITTSSSLINIIKPSIIEEPPKENKDEINKKIKSNINKTNDLGRFRVVKLGSMAPFSRGRWTCYDYIDESLDINNSKFLYTGSTLILPDKAVYLSLTNNSTTIDLNKNNNTAIIINNTISSSKDNNEIIVNEKNEKNNEILVNNSTENSESSGICSATIDTKIEHALDVVKNHLTHAVRLEVEELKIKINELVERISYLEIENDLLRSTVNPDVLQNLENQPRN